MNYYKKDIRNIKGDTYTCTVTIEDLGQNIDNMYFTCRDSLDDESNILFQKTINDGITQTNYDEENDIREFLVRIAPEDTEELQSGSFFYDLKFYINDDKFTIMKGLFIVEQNCTREVN